MTWQRIGRIFFSQMQIAQYNLSLLTKYIFYDNKQLCMVLKLGRFGQQIRNTWKVLKCGAGEGWRRSVGPIT